MDRNWFEEKTFLGEKMCPEGCIVAKGEMGSEKICSLKKRWAQDENIPLRKDVSLGMDSGWGGNGARRGCGLGRGRFLGRRWVQGNGGA
jgi:hypothetical protein